QNLDLLSNLEILARTKMIVVGPTTPRRGPPKFKQRMTRQFKIDDIQIYITVVCPWEAFSHLELHELTQYGII
uniref:3',5'-cyclic-GMP phosphodiesterase n=1 Tax=Sinocyclocheilus grahami TaxID=75366 RepID=A0A672S533_SINGR